MHVHHSSTAHATRSSSAHRLLSGVTTRVRSDRDERGDVPGWVLITVMSVGIVAALTALATDELTRILEVSLASVTR